VRFCALPVFCRLFQNDAQKAYKKHTKQTGRLTADRVALIAFCLCWEVPPALVGCLTQKILACQRGALPWPWRVVAPVGSMWRTTNPGAPAVREWYSQIGKMGGATTNPAKLAAIADRATSPTPSHRREDDG
jgi:hypothetical protein